MIAAVSPLVIDPALRGHVSPRTISQLERYGLRVHRIGRAAHVHSADHSVSWILGVWFRDARPPWADRLDQHHRYLLGRAGPEGRDRRRVDAYLAAWRRGRLRDPLGRFLGRLPWFCDLDGQPQPGFDWPRRRL